MGTDLSQPMQPDTADSIRLWEQRSAEYVTVVKQNPAAHLDQPKVAAYVTKLDSVCAAAQAKFKKEIQGIPQQNQAAIIEARQRVMRETMPELRAAQSPVGGLLALRRTRVPTPGEVLRVSARAATGIVAAPDPGDPRPRQVRLFRLTLHHSVIPGSLTLWSVHLLRRIHSSTAPLSTSNAAMKPNALASNRRSPIDRLGCRIQFVYWKRSAMPKSVVMDVDTGTDDALAILYAVRHPDLDLRAISCVAGNVALDQVVINTCKVLDAAGAGDIPVAAGAADHLVERSRRKSSSHGPDGLAGIQLPETPRWPSPLHAVDLLQKLIMDSPEPVSLVTLAPKTNVALLLQAHPTVAARIAQIIFMGGSVNRRTAEFNVWQDPEAAKIVIESPIPIIMYGLELFDRLLVGNADIDRFRTHDHPAIRLAGELLGRRAAHNGPGQKKEGLLGDAGALVLLTHPEIFVTEEVSVRVELQGVDRGKTIVARGANLHDQSWPRVRIVLDLDPAKAASAFVETINAYAAH
jgi:inosine-uridine nucleoside N-ribohydrolase